MPTTLSFQPWWGDSTRGQYRQPSIVHVPVQFLLQVVKAILQSNDHDACPMWGMPKCPKQHLRVSARDESKIAIGQGLGRAVGDMWGHPRARPQVASATWHSQSSIPRGWRRVLCSYPPAPMLSVFGPLLDTTACDVLKMCGLKLFVYGNCKDWLHTMSTLNFFWPSTTGSRVLSKALFKSLARVLFRGSLRIFFKEFTGWCWGRSQRRLRKRLPSQLKRRL